MNCRPDEEGLLSLFVSYSSWYWMWSEDANSGVCVWMSECECVWSNVSFPSVRSGLGSSAVRPAGLMRDNHERQTCVGSVRRATSPWSQSCCLCVLCTTVSVKESDERWTALRVSIIECFLWKQMTFVSLVGLLECNEVFCFLFLLLLLPPPSMIFFFFTFYFDTILSINPFFLKMGSGEMFVFMCLYEYGGYTFIHVIFSVEFFCTQCIE